MNRPAGEQSKRPYHHGDLRAALLAAAEDILERQGLQALTLRGAARAAGVSHAAPMNHFGDLAGLLSELAAVGYCRFGTNIATAMQVAGDAPGMRLKAMGRAYVSFARAHPGLFALMFRSERLDTTRPALHKAMEASRLALRAAIPQGAGASPLQMAARAAGLWSLVHGFATLLLDGRLNAVVDVLPPEDNTVDRLLDALLESIRIA
jgi:AcrR family transcriptional regulator